jgi:hypothetical protein
MQQLQIVDPTASAASCGTGQSIIPAVEPVDAARRRGTFSMISLGCPKNLVDTERMLGLLRDDGWQFVGEPEGSDLVIVNTCAFIDASRAESYAAVNEMLALKKAGGTRGVVVSGCLAERQKEIVDAHAAGTAPPPPPCGKAHAVTLIGLTTPNRLSFAFFRNRRRS